MRTCLGVFHNTGRFGTVQGFSMNQVLCEKCWDSHDFLCFDVLSSSLELFAVLYTKLNCSKEPMLKLNDWCRFEMVNYWPKLKS